jgi:hypothetical protein
MRIRPNSVNAINTLSSALYGEQEVSCVQSLRNPHLIRDSTAHAPFERLDKEVECEEHDAHKERGYNACLHGVIGYQQNPAGCQDQTQNVRSEMLRMMRMGVLPSTNAADVLSTSLRFKSKSSQKKPRSAS